MQRLWWRSNLWAQQAKINLQRLWGSQICEHNKIKSRSKGCGRSQIWAQNKLRSYCLFCGRSHICEHNNQRPSCKHCDPLEHLAGVVRRRVYIALKNDKEMSSTEYLDVISRRLKNTLDNNLQKACHGKITVNGISIIRHHWNITSHHLKRLLNGCTTQIRSLCGKWKYVERLSIYFWLNQH